MKKLLLPATFAVVLWNITVQGQSQNLLAFPTAIENFSFDTGPMKARRAGVECNPPFHVMGLYDPSVASDPYPIIFDQAVKNEIMFDGAGSLDKEFGDYDNDGDIDILYTINSTLYIIPNTGDATHPEYQEGNSINTGLTNVISYKLLDWYADGIADLIVLEKFFGDPFHVTLYLDIHAQIGFPSPIAILIDGATVPLGFDQFLEVGNINDDQYPDILISGSSGIKGTALFTSTFSSGWSFPVTPPYTLEPPQTYTSPMIPENGGSAPCPELFDADCDGDLDLFISDPLWASGGGHVDFYRLIDKASPQLSYLLENPNPYGLDDIPGPDAELSCDWVVTRFADFFGDGIPEAIAYDPCAASPNGDIYYYKGGVSCEASFSFFNPEGCQSFHFINTSTSSAPLTYAWNFGDPASGTNNISTDESPGHSFSTCGDYNVCLTISGDGCIQTICQVINAHDVIPPTALCLPGIGLLLDGNCTATLTPNLIDDGSFDNCLLSSLTLSQDIFQECGIFPVVLTVADWCGNSSECVSEVQVHEDVPPTIRCPPNVTVTSASPTCMTIVNGLTWSLLTDNCGTPTVMYVVTGATSLSGNGDASGQTFNGGISHITYTATDGCGNTAECTFDVNVKCGCECPNNLIKNPGFYEGATPGSYGMGANSDHWEAGSLTPQVVAEDSCCDAYSIQMWASGSGYYGYGESVVQDGLSLQQGHQYKISLNGKFLPSASNATSVNFAVQTSTFHANPFNCQGPCQTIGNSPILTDTAWKSFTLPIWTPTQNWDRIFIRPYNIYGWTVWGRIDNICVQEVNRSCCADETAFIENARNAITLYPSLSGQEAILDVGNLPECDSIAYIDWGDGNITQGPFGGNVRQKNYVINNIKARVQYMVIEYNRDVDPAVPCFQHVFTDSLIVGGPDTCVCSSFSGLSIQSSLGAFHQVIDLDFSTPHILPCVETGSGYDLTGLFHCDGRACQDESPITWMLTGPDGTHSGNAIANPYFGVTLLPAYFPTSGSYTLTLIGQCGNNSCSSAIQLNVDCPDVCPCTAQDIEDFQNRVERSFARVMMPEYGCQVQFSPIALNDCETVTWYLNDTSGTPIGESDGRQSFHYTFSEAGTYTIIMEATKKKKDGSVCDKQMRTQQVTVNCQPAPDCIDSEIDNSSFSVGAHEGVLDAGGTSLGWTAIQGSPAVVEGEQGSYDGWTIQLQGNIDTAGVLSRIEPFCLDKMTGLITVRIAVNDSAPGGYTLARPMNPHKPCDKIKVALYQGNPNAFRLNECDGVNCFELASISLEGLDTGKWHELQIPYDVSRWAVMDSCGATPNVLVRPLIYVTNGLSSVQGSADTYNFVQVDNICVNGNLVVLHDPVPHPAIHLYPNPTTGELTIELIDPAANNMSFRITNPAGQVVLKKETEMGKRIQTIDVSSLPQGMYFLQIYNETRLLGVEKFLRM